MENYQWVVSLPDSSSRSRSQGDDEIFDVLRLNRGK